MRQKLHIKTIFLVEYDKGLRFSPIEKSGER